jgi:hypothetical protein
MAPTIAEVIFWTIVGIIIIGFALGAIFLNPYYEEDDPYRYCPKEDKE